MSIVTIPPFYWPERIWTAGVLGVSTQAIVTATSQRMAFIFPAPKTGNIRTLQFRVTAATANGDTDCRLESVSSRNPSGSLFGTNTNGALAQASHAAGWKSVTMTADAAVTAGDELAMVLVPSGGSTSVTFAVTIEGQAGPSGANYPYTGVSTSSSYSLNTASQFACFAVGYDDGSISFIPATWPSSAENSHAFNSGSTPDEIGIVLTPPGPLRARGCYLSIDFDNAADIILYDTDGSTPLATVSPSNVRATSGGVHEFMFSSPVSLTASSTYRLAVKPGASNVTLYSFDVNAAGLLDMMSGGQGIYWTQQVNAGGWTETTTRRPLMGLIIDGIDSGGGGAASMMRPVAMAGGFV